MSLATSKLWISQNRVGVLDSNPVVRFKLALLANLIGFALVFYIYMDRVILRNPLPFLSIRELPIVAVGMWLILDRFGRQGPYKLTAWHYTMALFGAFYGVGLVYADLAMVRQSGILNYVDWLKTLWMPFVFFLVIQEAGRRKGFNYRILIGWLMACFGISALLGIAQAANIPGVRTASSIIWNWTVYDRQMIGPPAPWQARGVTAHQNAMAIMMGLGFALTPIIHRVYKKWPLTIFYAMIIIAATFATYSRGGILALTGVGVITLIALFIQQKWRALGLSILAVATLISGFFAIIYAFNVERFVEALEPRSVAKANLSIASWYDRERMNAQSLEKFGEFPIFGIRPASAGQDDLFSITYNAYVFEGLSAGGFWSTLAYYGIGGLFLQLMVFLCAWHPLAFRFKEPAVALAAIWAGTIMFVFSASENVLSSAMALACFQVFLAMHIAINGKSQGVHSLIKRLSGDTSEEIERLGMGKEKLASATTSEAV